MLESTSDSVGTAIDWLKDNGLVHSYGELADVAARTPGDPDAYFIPAFHGLGAPFVDAGVRAAFVGLSLSTSRDDLVRAVLDSTGLRVAQMHRAVRGETGYALSCIRADGGAAQCDALVQGLADYTGARVTRPEQHELTALGAAFLAGLHVGVWRDRRELSALLGTGHVFERQLSPADADSRLAHFTAACDALQQWSGRRRGGMSVAWVLVGVLALTLVWCLIA